MWSYHTFFCSEMDLIIIIIIIIITIIHEVLLPSLHTCPGMHHKKG